MRKTVIVLLIITAGVLGGCTKTDKRWCTPAEVELEGYTDKAKRLGNCFVEYPGEPTRGDKSYYIVSDICGQFSRELIENTLGRKVVRTEEPITGGVYSCTYYLNEAGDYLLLSMDYLNVKNQKIGQEALGRRIEKEKKIGMENMVVWQENGVVNSIYLVLGGNKFLMIQRRTGTSLTNDELINFAAKLAEEVKYYK